MVHSSFIARFELNEFIGEAIWDGEFVRVTLSGSADPNTRDGLRFLFAEAHAAAKAWGAGFAVMNLREAEFVNSACISAILGWANAVASEHEEERYKIAVLWDPDIGWERRTVAALQKVAQQVLTLVPKI